MSSAQRQVLDEVRAQPRGVSLDSAADPRLPRQLRRHEPLPLLADRAEQEGPAVLGEREPWFVAFINLLVEHGADQAVTVAAVDRRADLFAVTYVGWWEWAARRDPELAQLGCAQTSAARWSP